MPRQDVGRGDPAGHHVDHVGLGEDRADARALLGLLRGERERSDLLERDAEVAADVLDELAGPRGALARHPVAERRVRVSSTTIARAWRAPTSSTARAPGTSSTPPAGVRGHAVEMAGPEVDQLAFAGRRDVSDVLGARLAPPRAPRHRPRARRRSRPGGAGARGASPGSRAAPPPWRTITHFTALEPTSIPAVRVMPPRPSRPSPARRGARRAPRRAPPCRSSPARC